MKHVFWKWKMDLVLLPSPSILSYHSQGYIAHQVIKYQEHTLWKMFTCISYLSMEYVAKVKWMSNPVTDKIYTHSHTHFSQFTENAYNCFTCFSGLGTEIYKIFFENVKYFGEKARFIFESCSCVSEASFTGNKSSSKNSSGIIVHSLWDPTTQISGADECPEPMCLKSLCFKKLTLKTEVLRLSAW